jgi:PAS domain S-box-containing protein
MHPWASYQAQQWKYVFEITRAIASHLDLDQVLAQALRYAIDLINGEAGLIALRGAGDTFHFAAHYGIEPRLVARFDPLLTEIPLAIQRDQMPRWRFPELQLKFADVISEPELRLQYVMAIPLIASERLVGIIYVFRSPSASAFTELDQDTLGGFADHVAIAIEHARLYHDIAQRAQELATIIEGSANGILIADREGRVRSVNRALEQLTGWARDQAQSKYYHEIVSLIDEHDAPIALPNLADTGGQAVTYDGLLKRQDGSRGAFVHVTLAPLYDASRQLFSIVGNVVDVTGLKEAEKLKTTFLAGISHDLKTPLALIRGYAETLRRSDVGWNRQTLDEGLAIIQDEAEFLTNLVNALLDAAQLERGKLPLQLSITRVDDVAAKMVERFKAMQEGHQWSLEFPADFPAVAADAERIREVLQNLIGNAVKYSPRETRITVGGWVEPERIGVFVRDEGPGLSLDEQARVFDRFTRGRGRTAQRTQGAGLGLYLCRAIVEQHGGKIWTENLPARGAVFYFTLPRREVDA